LEREGATVASTPAEVARAGVVFSMVADDCALEAVTLGSDSILAGLPEGGVHVSMSTVGADTCERLARAHADAGRLPICPGISCSRIRYTSCPSSSCVRRCSASGGRNA
jgi:3-hydroxyisobutyrate dehydrogenase-like beta-hydroxyacid dehydrogenase